MESQYAKMAKVFKALSDPKRVKIVDMLGCGEMCGCLLLKCFEITQPTLAHDMKVLTEAGIVASRREGKKTMYSGFGEMLFTHFGVSGPLVLSASAFLDEDTLKNKDVSISIDLKPGLTKEELDKRVLKDFEENINRNFINSLDKLLPQKLIPVIVDLSGIAPETKVNVIKSKDSKRLV